MRHALQPGTYVRIGRRDVQPQASLVQGSRQGRDEAVLQVAIEALNLALGAGSVGPAGARVSNGAKSP